MIGKPPADPTASKGHVSICWPTSLLFGTVGGAVGFLMPLMDRWRHREVFKLYHPQDRAQEAPDFTWQNLVKAGENIASVVQSIHSLGYVIGDINESNFFVSEQTYVTLVDCDSIQVTDGGTIHRCSVGKAEFTPPELQGKDFSAVNRGAEQDYFGLAVLIFLLLMEGVHPYSGVWKGSGGDPLIEERIKRGLSPYGGSAQISPMPVALPFQKLPPSTRALFVRAFGDGHKNPAARPTPGEWGSELRMLGQNLVTCPKNTKHYYPAHLGSCMWCERAALFGGFDAYPLVQQSLPPKPFSTGPVARPQRATAPAAPPQPPPPPYRPAPQPSWRATPIQPSRSGAGSSAIGKAIGRFIWRIVRFCLILAGVTFAAVLLGVYLYRRWTAVPETKATVQETSSTSTPAPPQPPPVEEWPSDSPSMPVAGAIPGSDIRIGGLQFFSASPNPPPVEGRKFTNVFEHSNSDRIYWQLNLEHPQHTETQTFDLVVYLYGPDGSLRTRNRWQYSLEKGWTNSRLSNWWAGAISTWPMGEYSVSVFGNGTKVSSDKFEIQTAAVEPTQAANTPPPAPIQSATPITPGNSPAATDAPAQQSDLRQDAATAGRIPPATEAPLAQYQASHQVAGPDKKGFLTFWHGAFRFDSTNDSRPNQTFVIRREQVQFPHKNGVQVFGGKQYHFNVQGMTKEQVSDLFGRWYQGQ